MVRLKPDTTDGSETGSSTASPPVLEIDDGVGRERGQRELGRAICREVVLQRLASPPGMYAPAMG